MKRVLFICILLLSSCIQTDYNEKYLGKIERLERIEKVQYDPTFHCRVVKSFYYAKTDSGYYNISYEKAYMLVIGDSLFKKDTY